MTDQTIIILIQTHPIQTLFIAFFLALLIGIFRLEWSKFRKQTRLVQIREVGVIRPFLSDLNWTNKTWNVRFEPPYSGKNCPITMRNARCVQVADWNTPSRMRHRSNTPINGSQTNYVDVKYTLQDNYRKTSEIHTHKQYNPQTHLYE